MKDFLIKIARKIAARFKITEDITEYLVATSSVGQPSEVVVPGELLPVGLRIFFRGMLNNLAINPNLDWVLPYWIERQFNPEDISFMGRGHHLFCINCTHRNWTGIGCIGSKEEALVDPRGLLTPSYDGWSIDCWIYLNGNLIAPSCLKNILQYAEENLPFIVTEFEKENIKVQITSYAEKFSDMDFVFQRVKVKNLNERNVSFSLIFSIRPFNPEGISLVREIKYLDSEKCFLVNNKYGLILFQEPQEIFLSNYENGDVSLKWTKNYSLNFEKKQVRCKTGMAQAAIEYKIELGPSEEKEFIVSSPVIQQKKIGKEIIDSLKNTSIENAKKIWKEKMKKTMKIKIPDKRLQDCFDVNLSYILLLYDGDAICPGVFTYHHFWFRDAAYQVSCLDKMGYSEEAEKILLRYPERRKKNWFYSQNGEWDSQGQAIWTIVEHYKYTKNLNFLKKIYPAVKEGVRWIAEKRKTTMKEKSPHYGLLPAGLSAEHLGPNDYFYWDDFWAIAGIRSAIYAAKVLDRKEDEEGFTKIYDDFKRDLENSLEIVQKRLKTKAIPSSPYRRLDASLIGSVAVVYPLQLFSPFDERVIQTQKAIKENASVDGIFFQQMVHSGYGTYLNMQYAQTYLMQRDRYAWKIINFLLEKATPTFTWPEAINPLTGGGVIGDGHHGWAVADILHLIRNILFFEEEKTLVILPIFPEEWIKEGNVIEVENAPSYFGKVNYKMEIQKGKAVLKLDCEFIEKPEKIELNFPREIILKREGIELLKNKLLFSPDIKEIEFNF